MPKDEEEKRARTEIPTDYNQRIIRQALGFADAGIADRRQAIGDTIGGIESGLFDQLGRQQLQTERDIGQRRMQALRQGMPSSQLAAMELQNVQTAQLGAQQVAREYDQLRQELGMEMAGAKDMARFDLLGQLAQGRTDQAAIDAQRYEHDLSAQMKDFFGEEVWEGYEPNERAMILQALSGAPVEDIEELLDDSPGFFRRWANKLLGKAGEKDIVGIITGIDRPTRADDDDKE